jgi:hypothetical protein
VVVGSIAVIVIHRVMDITAEAATMAVVLMVVAVMEEEGINLR